MLIPVILFSGCYIRKNSLSILYEKEITDHNANEFISDAINNYKTLASYLGSH